MVTIVSSTALESRQNQILQTASAGTTGENTIDPTSTLISVFGLESRLNIQQTARRCNSKSSELSSLNIENDGDYSLNLFSSVNSDMYELQAAVTDAETAGQELLALPNLSEPAQAQVISTINSTVGFGEELLTYASNNFDTAIETIKDKQDKVETQDNDSDSPFTNLNSSIQNTTIEPATQQVTNNAENEDMDMDNDAASVTTDDRIVGETITDAGKENVDIVPVSTTAAADDDDVNTDSSPVDVNSITSQNSTNRLNFNTDN